MNKMGIIKFRKYKGMKKKDMIANDFLFIFLIFCILINVYSAFTVKNIVVVIGNSFVIGFFLILVRGLGAADEALSRRRKSG